MLKAETWAREWLNSMHSFLCLGCLPEICFCVGRPKLFPINHGRPWIKNNNSNLFDVTMGSYDGAEICELVGLFILNHLGKKFGKKNIKKQLYISLCLNAIEHSCISLTKTSTLYPHPTLVVHSRFRNLFRTLK